MKKGTYICQYKNSVKFYLKNTVGWGCNSMVELLPIMCEALGLILSTAGK